MGFIQCVILQIIIIMILPYACRAVHKLDITPTTFLAGLTRRLEVKCTFTKDATSVINSLLSLQILHSDKKGTPSFTLMANINADDKQLRGPILNTDAKVSGTINSSGESSLKISWSFPQTDRAGRYRCKANGVTASGQIVDSMKDVNVKAENPTTENVVGEMVGILKEVDALKTSIAEMKNFQKNKMNVTSSLQTQFIVSDEYKGHRYYLNSRTYFFTANDAHFRCHMYGGYLAEIDDAEEFNLVRNFLMTKGQKFYEVLLGGSDEAKEGQWMFPYSDRPVSYFNWTAGQPDAGRLANNLCLWRDLQYYMSDCISLMTFDWSYLCEIPVVYIQ